MHTTAYRLTSLTAAREDVRRAVEIGAPVAIRRAWRHLEQCRRMMGLESRQ